jgi:hypothetical protein
MIMSDTASEKMWKEAIMAYFPAFVWRDCGKLQTPVMIVDLQAEI